jgi:DNA polymerase IV (DinB-like DNA polymerase)
LQTNRVIIHVDFDYFYAQCEARENPSLKDKPVVICVYSGRGEDRGAVATANYIARKYGVKSGIPIIQAKRKLKDADAVFLPADFDLYERVSESIMNLLREYADKFEQVGIDEAFLDVTQKTAGNFEKAKQLAQKIQNEILEKEKITISIGIGPNKLVAKIAAGRQKPFGLTMVKPEGVDTFLAVLPVSELLGVGKKTTVAMEEMGIRTIGDLAKFDLEKLVKRFGKVLGVYFYNAAEGIDPSPVQERGMFESISHIPTLKEDTRDLDTILKEAYKICVDVYERAKEVQLNFKTVTAQLILQDMSTPSRSKTFETPIESLETLKETMKELFQKLLAETPVELKARRIGVKISNFSVGKQVQKHITEFVDKT